MARYFISEVRTDKAVHVLPAQLGNYELVPEEQATTYDSWSKASSAVDNLKLDKKRFLPKVIKQTFYLSDVMKMDVSEIRRRQINRIIAASNFDSETFSEKNVVTVHDAYFLKDIAKAMEGYNHSNNPTFYKAATFDYELYIWEP